MTAHTKLAFSLGVAAILLGVIFVQQIRDAQMINVSTEQLPLILPTTIEIPTAKTEPLLGNPGAPLTVVAYLNFGNAKSRDYYKIISDIVRVNPTKIRLYVKHYPEESFFSNPLLAHQALHCAGKQGQFWQFASALADQTKTPNQNKLTELAEKNKIGIEQWQKCISAEDTLTAIQNDVVFMRGFGLPSAPILFLNNKLLNPQEKINLQQLLTSFIAP